MKFSILPRLLVAVLVLLMATNTYAQKDNGNNKDPKTNTTANNGNKDGGKDGKDGKGKPEEPASAKSNNEVSEKVLANLENMTREEKNTMTICPMHGTKMSLSDNYRANASDYRQSGNFPFAYQLNYRRHCPKCTASLEAEDKAIEKENQRNANEATFERCATHNESMFVNGDHRPIDYEKNPSQDCPNAAQYGFKTYCKTCTKIHKIQFKGTEKAENR